MDTLSPELKELIVDKFIDDPASLAVLRTVSKAFYPRATFNLFRHVHASTISQFDGLSTTFQESSPVSTSVQHLHITLPLGKEGQCGCRDNRFVQLGGTPSDLREIPQEIHEATLWNNHRRAARGLPLNLLTHLETLRITHSPNGPWNSTTVTSLILNNMVICQQTFREVLSHLSALTFLSGCRVNRTRAMQRLFHSMEEEDNYYNNVVEPVDLGPSLEVLDIVNSQISNFFVDRVSRFALRSLRKLSIQYFELEHAPATRELLVAARNTLRELVLSDIWVGIYDSWSADALLDISAVPRITMHATGNEIFGPRNLTWFVACLASTESASALTRLTIHVDPESEFRKFFDNIRIWAPLDALLTGPRFRGLNISLVLGGSDVKQRKINIKPEEMQAFGEVTRLDILMRLPMLSARGKVMCSKQVIVE
ncbi:uncharacterized protein ARMOST_14431 [Armillaria ostoyae]|uniref:F-box domain-containing protein n=1 Tax=Armillaria ostoyae TaxID=47428 RepID=A0A284RQK5_ARMOS|nr:uncharacterized protein ARMOST_14431 [Armillaria ostoyae]